MTQWDHIDSVIFISNTYWAWHTKHDSNNCNKSLTFFNFLQSRLNLACARLRVRAQSFTCANIAGHLTRRGQTICHRALFPVCRALHFDDKPPNVFERRWNKLQFQQRLVHSFNAVNDKAAEASDHVELHIAKAGIPHNLSEKWMEQKRQ